MRLTACICFIVLGLPALLKAEAEGKPPPGNTLSCKSGSDTREIKNERREGGGCEVLYTKAGQAQPVASAQNEVEYCDGVVAKMKVTLEGAGFKCE